MPIYADCFECPEDIEIAMWDDPIISGFVKPTCSDCSERVPENCLWEVPDDDQDHPAVDIPDAPPEGDDWVVRDPSADREEKLREKFDTLPDDIPGVTPGKRFDIIVRDASNKEAIREARDEVRKRLTNDAGNLKP